VEAAGHEVVVARDAIEALRYAVTLPVIDVGGCR
jgi:hypothetical protein